MSKAIFIVFCAISVAMGICFSNIPYHLAADALSVGVGNLTSSSVCIYGKNPALDNECGPPCKLLLSAVWGDCYCKEPYYKPNASRADSFVRKLNVREIFELLGTYKHTNGATCRKWLEERERSWRCTN